MPFLALHGSRHSKRSIWQCRCSSSALQVHDGYLDTQHVFKQADFSGLAYLKNGLLKGSCARIDTRSKPAKQLGSGTYELESYEDPPCADVGDFLVVIALLHGPACAWQVLQCCMPPSGLCFHTQSLHWQHGGHTWSGGSCRIESALHLRSVRLEPCWAAFCATTSWHACSCRRKGTQAQ